MVEGRILDRTNSLGKSILNLQEVKDGGRKYWAITTGSVILYKTRVSDTTEEKIRTIFSRCPYLTVGDIHNKLFTDKVWKELGLA